MTFPGAMAGDWSHGAKFIINLGTGPRWSGDPTMLGEWWTGLPAAWTFAGAQNLTMQPVGSFLRIGNIQDDIGMVPQTFRRIPDFLRLKACQRALYKTFPQGTPIRQACGSFNNALNYTARTGSITTGGDVRVVYPVRMLQLPNNYYFNPIANNRLFRAANGTGADSGDPQEFFGSDESILVFNKQVEADSPGELLGVHMVACAQAGGNGWLSSANFAANHPT